LHLARQDIVPHFAYISGNKQLSYRRQTALQGGLVLAKPKVEDWNWETIFCEYYKSVFNHCDVIGQ